MVTPCLCFPDLSFQANHPNPCTASLLFTVGLHTALPSSIPTPVRAACVVGRAWLAELALCLPLILMAAFDIPKFAPVPPGPSEHWSL